MVKAVRTVRAVKESSGKGPKKREFKGDLTEQDAERSASETSTEAAEAPKRGRPRQARLPGVEDPEIEELESAAEEYAGIRDQRMALTPVEIRLKTDLLGLMKKYDKSSYVHDGFDIKVIVESEKVRVRIKKDKGD